MVGYGLDRMRGERSLESECRMWGFCVVGGGVGGCGGGGCCGWSEQHRRRVVVKMWGGGGGAKLRLSVQKERVNGSGGLPPS